MARNADLTKAGPWAALFASALALTDHLATVMARPIWTFGGGTVIMLRLDHRHSRDVDLFVPDPQYLGHVTPRLCDVAEQITADYVEAAEYVKLLLPTGEIDIVVGQPLTSEPWEVVEHRGRRILVETNAEILAKKMHHRGNQAKARDLFDLCAVADLDPASIDVAAPFFARHGDAFIAQLKANAGFIEEEFAQIQRMAYKRPFEECLTLAETIVDAAMGRA
ncbi:MAG TPA: nucleotidyl transferase AbiEii/AbiGii toxin family protein [Ramlibacter sp.]|uniref:nucleotidyl transferase AbiEii/AbiGii toxin family protein n=1 Tax=Ramlibacter sp. TaxID=1917967 RepID=UPI002ED2C7AC